MKCISETNITDKRDDQQAIKQFSKNKNLKQIFSLSALGNRERIQSKAQI